MALKAVYNFIVRYWKYLLAGLALIVGIVIAIVLRDNKLIAEAIERFRRMREIADTETGRVQQAGAAQSAAVTAAGQQLATTTSQINQQYAAGVSSLSASLPQRTDAVMAQTGGDAERLAGELGAATGINVILPKD